MTVNRSLAQMCLDFNAPNFVGTTAALGISEDWDRFQGFFNNPDVDSATTPELIWPVGGVITKPTVAGATTLVSDSASDAAAGTGARTILVSGLDANYYKKSETVTMNGVTPVTCANNYLRINQLTMLSAGTNKTNVGQITATINDGSPRTVSAIGVGAGISHTGLFTVAADYQKGLLQYFYINATRGGSGYCDFTLVGTTSTGLKYIVTQYSIEFGGSGFIERELTSRPAVLEPKLDLELICTATSANNVVVNALWTILLAKS